jgi:hypothetical protein
MLFSLDKYNILEKSGSIYRIGIVLNIFIPLSASFIDTLFCLNIAEKALPISHGIEPGPIRVFPVE